MQLSALEATSARPTADHDLVLLLSLACYDSHTSARFAMEANDSSQASGGPANSTMLASRPQPTSGQHADNPTSKDATMTNGDDDEDEEGMLKVDEEGQIAEDDGVNHEASSAPSTTNTTGYLSPRHSASSRDREGDRYHETSPGPSSSYAPQRPRFGYPAEARDSYGSASAYPYPRDPLRSDSFPSASRSSFSGQASRADNRRGWYASPTTAAPRGSDTYRPGANRERDRERDWDSFRDSDRDRDWSTLDRERERDAYRHSQYPPSNTNKYGFDNREFNGRRAASPSPNAGRDRDFDADRSRDRDREWPGERDPRVRASSAGWGNGGMRQWGKASDAGTVRHPASDDARSDTSQRPSGPRSNQTSPPAGSSDAGRKPMESDLASEKSETRSGEVSHRTTQSAEQDAADDKIEASEPSIGKEQEDPSKAANASTAGGDVQVEGTKHDVPTTTAPAVLDRDVAEPAQIEAAEDKKAEESQEHAQAKLATAAASAATSVPSVEAKTGDDQQPSEPVQEQIGSAITEEAAQEPEGQPQPTPESTQAGEPTAPSAQLPDLLPSSKQDTSVQSNAADAQLSSAVDGIDQQADAAAPSAAAAQASVAEESAAVATPMSGADVAASAPHVQSAFPDSVDEPMESASEATENGHPGEEQDGQPNDEEAAATTATAQVAQPEEVAMASAQEDQSAAADAANPAIINGPTRDAAPTSGSVDAMPSDAATSIIDGTVLPASASNASVKEVTDDIDIPDAASEHQELQQASEDIEVARHAPIGTDPQANNQAASDATAAVDAAESTELEQPSASEKGADGISGSQQTNTVTDTTAVTQQDVDPEDQKPVVEAQTVEAQVEDAFSARADAAVMGDMPTDAETADGGNAATQQESSTAHELYPTETHVKLEEVSAVPISDVSMSEAGANSDPVDAVTTRATETDAPMEDAATVLEDQQAAPAKVASSDVTRSAPETGTGDAIPPPSSQIQVSGQFVTATIDNENKTQEITLPQVDYGDDKEAQALVQQESARIEEVEMPAADKPEPPLRIAEFNEASKEVEPPMMTPTTQEQVDRAINAAVRQHFAIDLAHKDDWTKIMRENQTLSQRTTMDVLKAKIHGIPQTVSSEKPLWLDEEDDQAQRTKAQLYSQLLDRKKRLNEKTEMLKKRYRSINEEWKLHCSRLDRSAERREMLRRPPVNTPAGTPGAFGAEEPSPGGGGGGLLGSSLLTGRANRRGTQTSGFAGFGDAVRSEAEFLEILASLENADMQDPNMRAARTTATTPDMHIDPDSDHLMKLRYDDVNGFVADPLAFYLDEFDPDVWTDEEKAIFARRYALWPKQFGKIAQALPHKTPSQCVRYYYLNKKVPGNDFKALAAARNRERKRKARVKPKKAKGSALMADLKSAKGEEVDDVEDGSGLRSPVDATDPSGPSSDVPVTGAGRRGGGRSRMVTSTVDSVAGVGEDSVAGRKRQAEQGEADGKGGDAKPDKRKPGPKSKRAKSDSASATDKSRKQRPGGKKDGAALDEAKAGAPVPSEAALKLDTLEETSLNGGVDDDATPAEIKPRVEDSDLAAAEALGALAGLFGGQGSSDANANVTAEGELDVDGRKAGKKRRSKTAAPGEEGGEVGGSKGRGKQPTSSYWSVAERYEFLRALVVHGPRWEVVSSTLAQKSTAQARNYFARNEDETDFAEAAALARSHADAPLEEREKAALAFVRQRFASNSASALPSAGPGMPASGSLGSGVGSEGGRITHLPPPPGISVGQVDGIDVKMRDESPEPAMHRRGLQINSLLNDTSDAAGHREARRSSLHAWQSDRRDVPPPAVGRDGSVPPSLYARQSHDLDERRPLTADRIDGMHTISSEGRLTRDDFEERARQHGRFEPHRPPIEGRDPREEAGEPRPWMYESPYEARRRVSPSSAYASMAPPSHPAERGVPPSRYSMPPSSVSSSGHLARTAAAMPSHLSSSEEAEAERERERERGGYGVYGAAGRLREHESHSMPPAVPGELRHDGSGEQISPTSTQFGASHGYSRYGAPGVASLYPSTAGASASSALASRGRSANGPLTAPLPSSTSERPSYEQRWQRYSQSPGPTSAGSAGGHTASSAVGGYSAGSAYRSSNSPYSSFPSQSLPRPSLPSLSASSGGKVGAPHLPSLGAAGRSLPPILGTFPAPGRGGVAPGSRIGAGQGEEAAASRYWPYPHRPRGHEPPPSNRE
ncbi:putative DNA-binding protein SNT1 [Pseudozyma hubeiensis]|nr:putative DNA-binding protein SNT1 [Pseudozyma hubeiensis]